jgi:3',5'-cyclic AMP phosphodiesterase CpdA
MTWPLSILHLSDLHFGPHGRFHGEDRQALAERFHQAVEQARQELGWKEPVGLCIVTGDVAEEARPREYEEAGEFFEALIGKLGLARPRVIFAPGNHDVSWHTTKRLEEDQKEWGFSDEELARRIQEKKFKNFDDFLVRFHGSALKGSLGVQELGHGAWVHSFPEERLAIAVLNSCERESHLQQGGALSPEQAQALMNQWRQGEATGWIKLVAIHHNPVATVPGNVKSWVANLESQAGKLKPETIRHFAADAVGLEGAENLRHVAEDCHVQLVLHGHHHAAAKEAWHWTNATGHTLVLSAGSWGLRPDKLPQDQPNMMHLVRVDPASEKVQSVLRVFEPRARAEGHVQPGHFTTDPANPPGAPLRLSVPAGFNPEQAAPALAAAEASKAQEFIQEYRIRLKKRFERWDLRGVGAVQAGGAGRPIEATLDDMYLPIRLAKGVDFRKLDAGVFLEPPSLRARQKPLVVRGAAGSGKTTWMRWTFRRLVEDSNALPFMVELRRLAYVWNRPEARGAGRTLDAYLLDMVAESGASGWEESLAIVFKARTGPRPVLLVDGWDELGELGEELREKLTGFLEAHPRVLAVVSSRPYGASRPSGADGFEVLDLQPLSDDEISVFTHKFQSRVYGDDFTPANESARLFLEALNGSPEALRLARTPLLLTMMLLISRDRPLPDKRHLLYEECIKNLLSSRPDQGEREGVRLHQGQWKPLDSAERLRALAALAFQMQTAGYARKRSQIVGTLSELERMLPGTWKHEERQGFLAWLVGAAGVLVDRSDGTLSFTHLSFQEYLTAHHLATTLEGDEKRIQAIKERVDDVGWWETLRLWAATINDRNPAHLVPVLRELTQSGSAGFWLTGAFLADGIGDAVFEEWCQGLSLRFHLDESNWSDMSARAWSSSRQDERRHAVAKLWPKLCERWTWLAAVLARDWSRRARIDASGEDAFERIRLHANRGQGIGRSKALFGLNPVWPNASEELVFLRLIASRRAIISTQLQTMLSLGASHDDVDRVAYYILSRLDVRDDHEMQGRARDLARSLPWILARDLTQYWAHSFARDLEQGLGVVFVRDIAQSLKRDVEQSWTQDMVRSSVYQLAQYWSIGTARDMGLNIAQDMARIFEYDKIPEWFVDWTRIEFSSPGRAWTRVAVAQTSHLKGNHQLLHLACLVSLNPALDHAPLNRALNAYAKEGDALWPALARHLARCPTSKDRALLVALAQYPEKREEPLASGLKYYVRGDLVFEDGSEMTLDALCDKLGFPHLPYLEEMPPDLELEID